MWVKQSTNASQSTAQCSFRQTLLCFQRSSILCRFRDNFYTWKDQWPSTLHHWLIYASELGELSGTVSLSTTLSVRVIFSFGAFPWWIPSSCTNLILTLWLIGTWSVLPPFRAACQKRKGNACVSCGTWLLSQLGGPTLLRTCCKSYDHDHDEKPFTTMIFNNQPPSGTATGQLVHLLR